MSGAREGPPRFRPLTQAPRPARIAVALIGPLLWLAAFVVLAFVAGQTLAIAHGITVAFISFGVAIIVLLLMRRRRIEEEGLGEPRPDR